MEKQVYRKSLDLQKSGAQWSIDVKQNDVNSRRIVISLTDGGKAFILGGDMIATIYGKKTDGNVIYKDCAIENGMAIVDVEKQLITAAGTVECELRIYDSNAAGAQLLTTPRFNIEVYDVLTDENRITSTSDYSALASETVKSQEATKRANDIRGMLETKLANGELKGEKGDTGPQGEQGPKGDTGIQGPQGEKGEQGAPGTTDYTALRNRPITILSQDFKVSDLKESSLYFVNNGISCKKEDGSLLENLYAGILILTGRGGEAQVFDSENTFYVNDLSNGDWFNADCNHITTLEVNDLLSNLSDYNFTYGRPLDSRKKITKTISNFAESITKKTMVLDSGDLSSTISSNGKYSFFTNGIFRLGHPHAGTGFTPLEIKVNKGDTIYLKFSKTETECLCDIVYIGDISKNIPDDANYKYNPIDVWSGQLGFAIGATEYDSTLWDVMIGALGSADDISHYLYNLPCARTGGLVYSTKEEFGRPEFRTVTLGNGLKFENGVLSAVATGDIANDQLKQIIGGLE